jgi:hypothetical protein
MNNYYEDFLATRTKSALKLKRERGKARSAVEHGAYGSWRSEEGEHKGLGYIYCYR